MKCIKQRTRERGPHFLTLSKSLNTLQQKHMNAKDLYTVDCRSVHVKELNPRNFRSPFIFAPDSNINLAASALIKTSRIKTGSNKTGNTVHAFYWHNAYERNEAKVYGKN